MFRPHFLPTSQKHPKSDQKPIFRTTPKIPIFGVIFRIFRIFAIFRFFRFFGKSSHFEHVVHTLDLFNMCPQHPRVRLRVVVDVLMTTSSRCCHPQDHPIALITKSPVQLLSQMPLLWVKPRKGGSYLACLVMHLS